MPKACRIYRFLLLFLVLSSLACSTFAQTKSASSAPATRAAVPPLPSGPQTFHFPSIQTYASLNEVPPPTSRSDAEFEVKHLDMAHGGGHFDQIKALNPNFFYILYRLIDQAPVGAEEAAITAYCGGLGLDPENAYMHYRNDTTANQNGVALAVPGWPNGSAPNRVASRLKAYLGKNSYMYYLADPCLTAYMKHRSEEDLKFPNAAGKRFNGIFIDELGDPTIFSATQLPNPASGGAIAEYDGLTASQAVAKGYYSRDLNGLLAAVSSHLKKVTGGTSLFYPNIGNYAGDGAISQGLASDGVLTEWLADENSQPTGKGNARFWDAAKTLADAGKIMIFAEGAYTGPSTGYSPGNYRSAQERHTMFSLASYWMAMQPRSTYYEKRPNWDLGAISKYWPKAQEVDIGRPAGLYYAWQNGIDGAGQHYTIHRRDYTKSVVLFRTKYSWDPKDNANFSTPGAGYAIGTTGYNPSGKWQILYPDGTLGPVVTSVSLTREEGVVLMPAEVSPISN